MKNIHTILSELGITVPEDKKNDLDKAVAENYKTTAEHEKKVSRLTEDLTAMTTRAETAEGTLKGFEGKDYDAITRERDEWKRKHEEAQQKHQQEQEEREYNADFEAIATAAKCIDLKALHAHLDHDTLRKSRNRKADMEAAVNDKKTSHGHLFGDNGGKAYFDKPGGDKSGGVLTKKDIMAIKDPVERQAKIAANLNLFQKG